MSLTRRTVLSLSAAAAAVAAMPRVGRAAFAPQPGDWAEHVLTTRIRLSETGPAAQVWVPVAALEADDWQRPEAPEWTTTADTAELKTDPSSGAQFLHATWQAGDTPRTLELSIRVATRDRAVDLSAPRDDAQLSEADRTRYLAATELVPTDGIVKDTADQIVAGIDGELEKARAIYDWIVENTARNPETRGCGLGDVASMLKLGDLTGKCADLNALYVGLARAADLPARDLYGLRVAPSEFGYKSLGAGSSDVTKAQHCRAEVFLSDYGWVPVDPADVRKVMLEEPPKDLSLDNPKVVDARAGLFGAWEGNWIAYNDAHDVPLPGAEEGDGVVPFLMYPQAEIDGTRLDSLSPQDFVYEITAETGAA